MNTSKPKSKKTVTEPLQIDLPIEKAVVKKVAKKPSIAKASVAIETKEVVEVVEAEAVEAVEVEAKTDVKKIKSAKVKVIRDSFSFPEQDYLKISELKKTCLAAGIHVKKGEILRAGLHLLTQLSLDELKLAVEKVEKVQTGRPTTSKI
ncbi:MAG: hypothetical protein WCS87_15715 [Methylococcaceae bacterium]